jgi:hypothetical protein
MLGRWAPCFLAAIWLAAFTERALAQSSAGIAGQIIVDMGAAAGSEVAPPWAQGLGYASDAASVGVPASKGDYLDAAEQAINVGTETAAGEAGRLVAGQAGAAVAGALAQGALDVGDLVIAPQLANALVTAFPGVFVPGQKVTVAQSNPFGTPPSNATARSDSRSASSSEANSAASRAAPPAPLAVQIVSLPKTVAASTASSVAIAQSTNTAWFYSLMDNTNNDLSLRKLAAIALGINPDIITSDPNATKLLAAVYGVSLQPNGASSSVGQKSTASSGAASTATNPSSVWAQANSNAAIIKTIIPGRQSAGMTAVSVTVPQNKSSAIVQTIVPGAQANSGSIAHSAGAITTQPPPPTGAQNSVRREAAVTPNSRPENIALPANSAASAVRAQPGGISLSQAAAQRLPLNFILDGAFIDKGRIILSGANNSRGGIDAALFLTALRAACQNSDPYFSLDADNLTSWLTETKQAADDLAEFVKQDTAWNIRKNARQNTPSIIDFKTISASQAHPAFWQSILKKYPDLRSRLVFRPDWLRQTRFGEILYTADVLLKELAGGASALGEARFRAAAISGYRSATERKAAIGLLFQYNGWTFDQPKSGGRVWYDLTESSEAAAGSPEVVPPADSELRRLLDKRGLLTTSVQQSSAQRLSENDGALDLSDVYPRMYVRVFDPLTHRDTSARFPGLNELVAQANATPEQYASVYKEYEALVGVFRAYIVAVRVKQAQPSACARLPNNLLDAEKATTILPQYHPTDFTVTVGWYEYSDGQMRRAIGASGGLFQGGVSIGASRFLQSFIPNGVPTPIIMQLKRQAVTQSQSYAWKDRDGRRYVSLTFDDDTTKYEPTTLERPEVQPKTDAQPAVAGTIGRYDLYQGARIDGMQLNSMTLPNPYIANPGLAQNECATFCSGDNDCIGFDIDQKKNLCTTYSSVLSTHLESNWIHGIWK